MRTHQITAATLLGLGFVPACRRVEPSRPAARDFGRIPPGIESATVRPLAAAQPGGNAVLEVRFERGDSSVLQGVSIYPRGKEIVLRDDGTNGDSTARDGVFSAIVDFDFAELSAQVERGSAIKANATAQPVFRGRIIVGIEDSAMVRARLARFRSLRDVTALISARTRVDLFDLVPAVDPLSIDPARSLMITDPSVVTDLGRTVNPCLAPGSPGAGNPNGRWTFKHLVTEMVAPTGIDPATFVEAWLREWAGPQTVSSGFVAQPRPNIASLLITPWPRTGGKLDLDRAPFRLAAIVNRIDLGTNPVCGGAGSAGEGRFIFGVLNRAGGGCSFLPFSVIFEYGIPRHTCPDVRDWAARWVALSSLALGSTAYNSALEAITNEFVRANADPAKPNGSALNQLRTNEIALASPWELREFNLDAGSHLLVEVTTKQTPDETLNDQPVIAQYVNANATAIKLDQNTVPDHFPGATDPFLAATSRASPAQQRTIFTSAGILDNEARFHFSFHTCTACHIRETSTNGTMNGVPGGEYGISARRSTANACGVVTIPDGEDTVDYRFSRSLYRDRLCRAHDVA